MKNFAAKGFTLYELLVTIALAAVVAGIAAPNMSNFVKNNRLTGSANDMLAAIYSARAEAIKQQLPVTMCFSSTPLVTASAPACDGNGTQGWIVWVDNDSDGIVDAGEDIKVRHEALPSTLSVVVKPAAAHTISYGANGFTRSVANTLAGVVICDDRKNNQLAGDVSTARGVLIEVTGRPSVTKSYSKIKTDSSFLDSASTGTCVGS